VGSAGHVVHSYGSGSRNVDTLFFMVSGTSTNSTKSASGHITLNLFFLHPVGSMGHIVHSSASNP
jgi:hypothetical protein